MDYYKVLQLDSKTATHQNVADAFRRLSVKNHPLREEDNKVKNMLIFNQLCEAYEVLSDPQLKQVYDQNGAEGLT